MQTANPSPRRLPGDWGNTAITHRAAAALRVDHAGEYSAVRIYKGQLAVLKNHPLAPELRHMAAQEEVHLAEFNRLLPAHGVRPSALLPLWHVAGFALGAGTALLGARAAMACTVAVESVITEHYNEQLQPGLLDPALMPTITKFRDEEMEHHDLGLAHEAEKAPAYAVLSGIIRTGCRAAIWVAARV